jgi:hypothetical protein
LELAPEQTPPRLTDRFVVLFFFCKLTEHERLHMLGFLCQTEQPCVDTAKNDVRPGQAFDSLSFLHH